jgi:oligopeptidase B
MPAPVAQVIPHPTTLHGETRADDYFWLREKTRPAVRAYLKAENAHTRAVLAPTTALRKRLYREMLSHIQETDASVPYRYRGWWYYSRITQGQQYPVYARKPGHLAAPEEVLLDLNALARGQKFLALGEAEASDDGGRLAYTLDRTGFREYSLRVKDLRSGKLLPARAEHVDSLAWAADNRTLFYVTEDDAKRPHRLWRRRLGQARATLVYEERDERFELAVDRSRSTQFLFLISDSHTQTEIRFLPADQPEGQWRLIAPRQPDHEYAVDHSGAFFYLLTNDRGRNFRLVQTPIASPQPEHWREVIPHRADVLLTGLDCFARHLVVEEMAQARPQFLVTEIASGSSHRIAFSEPAYDVSEGDNHEFDTNNFRYGYESFLTPDSTFDYDLDRRESRLLKRQPVPGGYDPARYVAERLEATAPDGVRVPISLVRRRDTPRDGSAPLLLNGYGAYGVAELASFDPKRLSLLDRGVVVALAHVRGGSDLGQPWHDAGRMLNKRNTFTDFIAVADHLVRQRYTCRKRLAIEGGSAGGLLIGAVLNLRPDLCGAALLHVPFVDVINTMLDEELPLTVGEFEEWGNPKIQAEYDYLRTYSPYDNLRATRYPAMWVTTSLNDSQVMYWEPAKYVAKLRTLQTRAQPLLFKIDLTSGHGGPSGRYDRFTERALDYAFLLWQWGWSDAPGAPARKPGRTRTATQSPLRRITSTPTSKPTPKARPRAG